MRNYVLFIVIILGLSIPAQSQIKITEKENVPVFYGGFGGSIPDGDLADRFGISASVGGGFMYKTTKGWLWGADFQYLFGGEVKEDSILDALRADNGEILNEWGEYADVLIGQSGFYTGIKFGKVFNVDKRYPNSGIMFTSSLGVLQHKIHITNQGNNAPQIIDDYVKGYDRLTYGIAIQEFIGYLHLGNSQYTNFYAGIEFTNGWTLNRRSLNFDTKIQDTTPRIDQLWGIRVGWIIPIYRNAKGSYYY